MPDNRHPRSYTYSNQEIRNALDIIWNNEPDAPVEFTPWDEPSRRGTPGPWAAGVDSRRAARRSGLLSPPLQVVPDSTSADTWTFVSTRVLP